MHHVQLDLNHDNFYCPATGFHMLSAEHYEASPATLFVHPEDAGEFKWYSRKLEKLALILKMLCMNVKMGFLI